jgi:hypothetical protein
MTKFTLLAIVAFLPALATSPAHAMAAIQEPGAYAFVRPNADFGIGSSAHQPRVGSRTAFGAFALAPTGTRHARGHK